MGRRRRSGRQGGFARLHPQLHPPLLESLEPRLLLSTAAVADTAHRIGWDADTSGYSGLADAIPTGESYFLYDNWGGTWCDAEKSPTNIEDDLMCWAASASNALEWTGWGDADGMTTTDEMFEYFQDHWTDDGGLMEYGWDWWFDGTYSGPVEAGWSQVDVPGGGFFPSLPFDDYYHEETDVSQTMAAIDDYLHAGYSVTLGVYADDGSGAHAITCWGYSYDPSEPTNYTGIWVTDSDDDKTSSYRPDRLRYYEVVDTLFGWYLQDFYGVYNWFIGAVQALEARVRVDDLHLETGQDTPVDGQVTGADPQGGDMEFAVVGPPPSHGAVDMDPDGSFTYTPDLGFYGQDSFTFNATDTEGATSSNGTVTVLVNDRPVAADTDWSTDEDTTGSGQALASDVQPQSLTYNVRNGATHGVLEFNSDGSFDYTPDENFNGLDSFTFYVSDGLSQSDDATVSITVNPVNDAPTPQDRTLAARYMGGNLAAAITLSAPDVETSQADLVFTITGAPAHGSFVLDGNQLTYTANAGFFGVDTMTFTATDTGDPAGGDQGWGFDAATSGSATLTIGVPRREDFQANGTFTVDLDGGGSGVFVLRGPGTAWAYTFAGIAFDTPLDVAQVVVGGSDPTSVLSIRNDARMLIGGFVFPDGSMGAILGPDADLLGDIEAPNGGLAQLSLHDASEGVMTIGGTLGGRALTASFARVSGFSVHSAMPIKGLTVVDWTPAGGLANEINAPYIRSLRSTGRRADNRSGAPGVPGDFDADLTLTGAGLGADDPVLYDVRIQGAIAGADWNLSGPAKSLRVAGGMRGATVRIDHSPASASPALDSASLGVMDDSSIFSTGNMRNLTIDGMVDSNVFAGVINWVEADGMPDPYTQIDTPAAMGGAGGNARIERTTIRGALADGWYVDNFVNSTVAAYDVGAVVLRNAGMDNGGLPFGVSAWRAGKVSYFDRNRSLNWSWPNTSGAVLASDSDLTVDLAFDGVDSFTRGERVISDAAGDAGFAYSDVTDVSLRVLSGWARIAIRTALPLEDLFAQGTAIRVKLDTNRDFFSLLSNDDTKSDYCLDWLMDGDQLNLYTGGGYWLPDYWTNLPTGAAYSTLTEDGIVLSLPLDSLPDLEYLRIVDVEAWKDTGIVDAAG